VDPGAVDPGAVNPGAVEPGAAEPGGLDPGVPLLELVLHREEPVVAMRVVPVERVRLVRTVVRDERTLREQLRKERAQAEVETPR
jgi:hypothetical protein